MPKRRRGARKRKNNDDTGPPHKKQRTAAHTITIPHPQPSHSNSNSHSQKQSSSNSHSNTNTNHKNHNKNHNHNHKNRNNNYSQHKATKQLNTKNIVPFKKQKRVIQIGQSLKEYQVADLMLFEFFRKRYSKIWTKYNSALLKQQQESKNQEEKQEDIQADFANSEEENEGKTLDIDTETAINEKQEQELDESEDICSIFVDNFGINDFDNLIFFLKNNKIAIRMEYIFFSSFLYISDFFTVKIKSIHFERYFDHYPALIPYEMFDKWLSLNIFTQNNKKELKMSISAHLNKYRKVSFGEKKKIILCLQKCVQRIKRFSLCKNINDNYNSLDLSDLCVKKSGRLLRNNGERIIIDNDNNNICENIRELNENYLQIYWEGFKTLNIKLNEDYNAFIDKYVLKEITSVINYYFCKCNAENLNKSELQSIAYSKLMYILTDIYALLFQQKAIFNQWQIKMKPLLQYIYKLAFIFYKFNVGKLQYDMDENKKKNICFTKLFKRFLIHALKNKSFKFNDIMKKLVYKQPFISYLYQEEEFMTDVFFKNIELNSIQQTKLAKKLQTCNVYFNHNNNDGGEFKPKYKEFIRKTLGICNQSHHSLLMDAPL